MERNHVQEIMQLLEEIHAELRRQGRGAHDVQVLIRQVDANHLTQLFTLSVYYYDNGWV